MTPVRADIRVSVSGAKFHVEAAVVFWLLQKLHPKFSKITCNWAFESTILILFRNFRKRWNAFKRICMRSTASKQVGTQWHLNVIWKVRKSFNNVKSRTKRCEQFHDCLVYLYFTFHLVTFNYIGSIIIFVALTSSTSLDFSWAI